MNSEHYDIKTGPDGEPVVHPAHWKSMTIPVGLEPTLCVKLKGDESRVEVAPGIMVSERAISAAVEATTDPHVEAEIEHKAQVATKAREEMRKDLDITREVIESFRARMREPLDPKEKYVSFDAMSPLLQRVVTAYTAASEANKELNEALAELKTASLPPTV